MHASKQTQESKQEWKKVVNLQECLLQAQQSRHAKATKEAMNEPERKQVGKQNTSKQIPVMIIQESRKASSELKLCLLQACKACKLEGWKQA